MGFDCAILVPHAPLAAPPVRAFAAAVNWAEGRPLAVCFRLEAILEQLALPAASSGQRRDQLWEHTCFEAFVAPEGAARYLELNFSPSGDWAAYGFTRYRRGRSEANVEPEFDVRIEDGAIEVDVLVAIDTWLGAPPALLEVGLSAVLEDHSGTLSHWAAHHGAKAPDFHHRRSFVLRLGQ